MPEYRCALWRVLVWLLLLATLPASAASEEIRLPTPAGALAGTLTLPDLACPCPVVLIIAGSGPTDRDGNNPTGLHSDAYRQLAQRLAEAGIASLRYDKRGLGASVVPGLREQDLRFEMFVDDARHWLTWLAGDARFAGIAVLGHSEGSLIGMLAITPGAGSAPRAVRAFVSLAGLGRAAAAVLRQQLAGRLPPALIAPNQQILAALEAGQTVEAVPPQLLSLYRPSVQPFLIDWFRHRPEEIVARLPVPVLIVQGERDIQVSVADARLLQAARPDAAFALVPGMTHTLKHIDSDAQQGASYTSPQLPLAPRLLDVLLPFLRAHLSAPI